MSSSIIDSGSESVTSMAMQQGGMGLILTALIVSAPPMAAMLFQGTLGQFSGYNAMFNQAPPPGTNMPPQSGGYTGGGYTPPPAASSATPVTPDHGRRMVSALSQGDS